MMVNVPGMIIYLSVNVQLYGWRLRPANGPLVRQRRRGRRTRLFTSCTGRSFVPGTNGSRNGSLSTACRRAMT